MKKLKLCYMVLILSFFLVKDGFALIFLVDIHQDADVVSGTQWVDQNESNQGVNPEIEPIRANDGYDTKHVVYLGFDFLSNEDLKNALLEGNTIEKFKLYAYNVRNFARGDASIQDVVISLHYVNNDFWWEGPYENWTAINSSDPIDGITYDNQVGYNEYLASENEDLANKWYVWEFQADSFTLGGAYNKPEYLSLAMVPNSLEKDSSWWLVSSFASKENEVNLRPYLEVYTRPIPEPATVLLFGIGLVGMALKRKMGER